MEKVRLRLKELRTSRNLTHKQVAEVIEISPEKYRRIESGKIKLKINIIIELAVFYNTSADYIVGQTDDIIPYPRAKRNT